MTAPKSPQDALRIQRIVIVMVWLSLAAMAIVAVVVLTTTPTVSWGLKVGILGFIGMMALLFASFLTPAHVAADNFRQHGVGDDGHQCQCRDCGQTFTPAPGSPQGPPSGAASPQQGAAAARSVLHMIPFAGLVLLLALIAAVVVEAVVWTGQSGSLTQFFISDAVVSVIFTVAVVLVSAVGLVVVALVARAKLNESQRQIASHPPQHGCTCMWCGRGTGQPAPRQQNANPLS